MTRLLYVFFLWFIALSWGNLLLASEYLTTTEFYKLHPEQIARIESFNEQVQQKAEPIPDAVQQEPVRITFITPGNQISDYWRRSIVSFEARMQELKIQYKLEAFQTKAGDADLRLQEAHLQKALANDPDYLVYTLNILQQKRLIERIIAHQRPKLIIQNLTTPLKSWEGNQPFMYVGFDHVTGTEILARHALKLTGGKGDYGVLYFSRGYISEMRGDAFNKFISRNSTMNFKYAFYTNGDFEKSRIAAQMILKDPSIKLIYACSTDIAFGVIDAVSALVPERNIIINGWGGGSAELKALKKGQLAFTVMRMNDDNGVAMAEAIKLDLIGRSADIPTVYSGDMQLILNNTPPDELTELVHRAFRYSGVPDP